MTHLKRSIRPLWFGVLALACVALGVAGCGSPAAANPAAGGGAAVLNVVGPSGAKAYTLDQLKALPSAQGYAGTKSSTGKITAPVMVKGVPLQDLFGEVGGLADNAAISIAAKDDYEMTMSMAQLKAGDFITYDMVTGVEQKPVAPLKAIIAYEADGKLIDPNTDGPLRLEIISDKLAQVTDGHWSVKWVVKVQAKSVVKEWKLSMSGARSEDIDRATFESGAAANCHGQDWTDAEGVRWTGIPLYLLVGRVDDQISHGGPAYNRDLANAGYQVKLTASDGASVEVSSKTMYYKKDLIVAYLRNGEPLPDDSWPLRLVGEGIDKASMIGKITRLQAMIPGK
jgi:DMSO/TMAO reductase YedYZ molybdopterin-dependent catalytic subunit